MSTYLVVAETDGTYAVHVEQSGSLPGRYTGFKSRDDADRWIAEQQKQPDLPPPFDKGFPGI